MGLPLGQAVTLELLNELEKLHATDVAGHNPERMFSRIEDDTSRLCVDKVVVTAQSSRSDRVFVILLVDFFNGRAHDALILRNNRIF